MQHRPYQIALWGIPLALAACTAEPEASHARSYLFDLDEDTILAALDHYEVEHDPEETLARMATPFDCSNFLGACDAYGEAAAEAVVESVWRAAQDRVPVSELVELVHAPTSVTSRSSQNSVSMGDDTISCSDPPFFNYWADLHATAMDVAIFVYATASYESKRRGGDLIVATSPHNIDADLSLEIRSSTGVMLASHALSFAASADGDIGTFALTTAKHHDISASLTTSDLEDGSYLCDGEAAIQLEL